MTTRSRAARHLAEHLTDQAGTPVALCWDNPTGRPGHGHWRVEWTDGPTTATMRGLATNHARWIRPLEITRLCWSRQYSPTAWAAALQTRATTGTLPDTAREAVALVEYDLHELDTTTWSTTTVHAAEHLAGQTDGDPTRWLPPSSPQPTRRNPVTKPHQHPPHTAAATAQPRSPPPPPAAPPAGAHPHAGKPPTGSALP